MRQRLAKKRLKKFYGNLQGDGFLPKHMQGPAFRKAWLKQKSLKRLDKDIQTPHYRLIGKIPVRCPMSLHIWYHWKCRKMVVKFTEISDSAFVSTVMLPFDHSMSWPPKQYGEGAILFETMCKWNNEWDRQIRDATWDDAVKSHDQVVASLKEEIEAIQGTVEEITK